MSKVDAFISLVEKAQQSIRKQINGQLPLFFCVREVQTLR